MMPFANVVTAVVEAMCARVAFNSCLMVNPGDMFSPVTNEQVCGANTIHHLQIMHSLCHAPDLACKWHDARTLIVHMRGDVYRSALVNVHLSDGAIAMYRQ